jgi:hypothetical protein
MLDYIYPEEGQRFFTDREHHLGLLELSKTLLADGIRKHLALSGFRRIGKTVILKEFLRRHVWEETSAPGQVDMAYLDLPRLAFTPEAFAAQYIGSILYWLLERGDNLASGNSRGRIEPYLEMISSHDHPSLPGPGSRR